MARRHINGLLAPLVFMLPSVSTGAYAYIICADIYPLLSFDFRLICSYPVLDVISIMTHQCTYHPSLSSYPFLITHHHSLYMSQFRPLKIVKVVKHHDKSPVVSGVCASPSFFSSLSPPPPLLPPLIYVYIYVFSLV